MRKRGAHGRLVRVSTLALRTLPGTERTEPNGCVRFRRGLPQSQGGPPRQVTCPKDKDAPSPRHPLTPGDPDILVSRGVQGDQEPSGTVSTLGSRRDDVPQRAKAGPCDGTRPAGVPVCARLSCWPGVPPRCRRGPGRPCPPSAPPWRRQGSSSTGGPGGPGAA